MQILKPASSADNSYPRPERGYPHPQQLGISIPASAFARTAVYGAMLIFLWIPGTAKSAALESDSHTLLVLHFDGTDSVVNGQGAGRMISTPGLRGSAGY